MESWAALDELIAAHPFLSGTSEEFQSILEDCASLRRFGSHQLIFQQGSEADHFYLILSGKVVLETIVPPERRLAIQTLGAGEALGWSWLFPPYQWTVGAVTAAPTDVISLGARHLRQRAEQDPEFGNELMRRVTGTLVQRLHATRNELVRWHTSMAERRAA
jgi:CRP/FNR family transcriptional regulator, cyclic AMP receptor protein